jgi:hypothetical protein
LSGSFGGVLTHLFAAAALAARGIVYPIALKLPATTLADQTSKVVCKP